MYRQFGLHPDKASDKVTVQAFRRKVLRELKKIKLAWPGLNYATAPGVLILHPSTPKIAPLNQVQLGRSCLSGYLSKPLPLAYGVIPLRSGLRGRVRLWAKASPWPPSEPCSVSETGVQRRPACSCGAMDLQTIAP